MPRMFRLPLTKVFLEFNDVKILLIDYERNYFEFTFTKEINLEFNSKFVSNGYFKLFDDFVFTSVELLNEF